MGSFNVACSISNVSLGAGTNVVFYPLLPKRFGRGETMLESSKHLLYQNCYYQPFSLPIKGVYNDYGSIESIEEDDNTKAIEAFFGISIQDFVDNIGDNYPGNVKDERDQEKENIYLALSGMFVHRAIFQALVAFDLKESHLANGYVTEEIARFYDFQVVPPEEQVFIDTHHDVLMRKEGVPYDLKIGNYGAVLLHARHKEYYAFAFDKRYGKEVARHWEEFTKTKLVDVFPPTFDFNKLSEEQYQLVKEKFKELTGAPLGWSPEREEKYSIYSVKDFADVYEKVTGDVLDIDIWTALSTYDTDYNDFQKAIRQYKPKKKNYQEMFEKTTDEAHRKLLQQIIQMANEEKVNNDFGYEVNQLPFYRFFKEMDYFKALYQPILLRGGLRHAFKEHQAFYHSMYACNRFFFPAMNGEQCGNAEATSMLLQKSMDIVQERGFNNEGRRDNE